MITGAMVINSNPGCGRATDPDLVPSHCSDMDIIMVPGEREHRLPTDIALSSSLVHTSPWIWVAAQASQIGIEPMGAHPLDTTMVIDNDSSASWASAGPLVVTEAMDINTDHHI